MIVDCSRSCGEIDRLRSLVAGFDPAHVTYSLAVQAYQIDSAPGTNADVCKHGNSIWVGTLV